MRDVYSFALSSDGMQLAVGDGPELLVYRGDGQPVYKVFCDGILLGMAFVGDTLATVDSEGRVVFHRAADGRKLEEVQLDSTPLGAFASPDGAFAVITTQGPVLVEPNGQAGGYPLQDLVCASFGPDRTSLGLGTSTGHFVAMDGMSGAAWGSLPVGMPIIDVKWNHQGFWVLAVEGALLRVDGGATAILGREELEGTPRQLAISSDGALCAVLLEGGRVAVVEQHTHQNAGHVVFRRDVHAIAFGRAALLGFGLDDGDASLVDLITRATVRTEPHPGRGRNNWNVDLSFDGGKIRGAVTLLRSGGAAPILHLPQEDVQGGRRGWLGAGCMLMNAMVFACGGCLGISFMLHYMKFF